MFMINGIAPDSQTFYIKIQQRGSQIGTPFKDQPYVKVLLTFNYTTRPSHTSFALPTGYLLATSLMLLALTYALALILPF